MESTIGSMDDFTKYEFRVGLGFGASFTLCLPATVNSRAEILAHRNLRAPPVYLVLRESTRRQQYERRVAQIGELVSVAKTLAPKRSTDDHDFRFSPACSCLLCAENNRPTGASLLLVAHVFLLLPYQIACAHSRLCSVTLGCGDRGLARRLKSARMHMYTTI